MTRTYTEVIQPEFLHTQDFMKSIAFIVCCKCLTPLTILQCKNGPRKYSDIRHIYMHFCRLYTDATLKEIGQSIGHSGPVAMDAFISIRARFCNKDRKIYSMYVAIKEEIDKLTQALYPVTYQQRMAQIHQVTSVSLSI